MQIKFHNTRHMINEVIELAKSKLDDEYYRGQIVLAKIVDHNFILDEENEIPQEIIDLKKSIDEHGNINKYGLKTLEGFCYVDFDLDLIGLAGHGDPARSKYFDLNDFIKNIIKKRNY